MSLTFPRDLVLEAYLGRWVDVTALPEGRSLRQVEPVTVSWGSSSEQAKSLAPPSTVEGVLNNTGGHWTPGNPMSDYYAYLQGRNVPTRLALRVARDDCNDVVVNGWGTLDTGETWQVGTGAGGSVVLSDWQKDGDSANHSVPVAAGYRQSWVNDAYRNLEVAAACRVDVDPVSGGDIEPANLILRRTAGDSYYLVRCVVASTQMVRISIYHHDGGGTDTLLAGPVDVPEAVQSAGHKSLWVKAYVEGETLRAKVWQVGTDEPLGWRVSAHDDRLPAAGGFGVRSGVGGGNTNTKPILFQYTVVEARLLQHSGELAKLEPTWDESHRVKRAKFKSADVTQRLGRPQRASLSSAPRRWLSTTDPAGWWPLDEPDTAIQGAPLAGSGFVRLYRSDQPSRSHWGQGRMGAVEPRSLRVIWNFVDSITIPTYRVRVNTAHATAGGSWCVDFTIAFETILAGSSGTLEESSVVHFDVNPVATSPNYGQVSLSMVRTSAGMQVGIGGTAFSEAFFTVAPPYDGAPHHVRLQAGQFGGSVIAEAFIDGVSVGSNGATTTLADVFALQFQTHISGSGAPGYSLSNLLIWPNGTQPDLATSANAARGWVGERAGLRAFRLCAEEGLSLDYWGDLGQTRAMGPQRPAPLLDLVAECAEVDGAFVFAPRYTNGVAFRGRRALGARSADLTLDYAAGQLAPPFAPSSDDRPTANLVRAERVDGGFVVVEQASGPMNTGDPGTDPEAVGVSPAGVKVHAESDVQLPDVGGWVRALGTVPEVRFPHVTVNLRSAEVSAGALQDATLALGVGDRLLVQNLQAADVYRDLDQLVRGGKETYRNVRSHQVTLNAAPYEKYRAGVYGDANSRYDGAVTTLNSSLGSATTGARNVTTTSGPVWTNAAGAFPLDVDVGGERVTVSGVTGTGATQVMTISVRSVNGVVKSHLAGTRVRLWQPVYYC